MFDSISEIKKKHFIVHEERNSVALIITKIYSNKIIFGTKYELFIPLYQITFFLGFGQTRIFFSSHILMNILIYILFCDKKKT